LLLISKPAQFAAMLTRMNSSPQHLGQPVTGFIRHDFAQQRDSLTVQQALEAVRREGIGEKIVYFYVVDADRRLVGVVPTRRLLIATAEERIGDLMIKRVVAIPQHATLLEACEFLVMPFGLGGARFSLYDRVVRDVLAL